MILPSPFSKAPPSRGFTLLEVLAALVVVGIGLTALFSALSQGVRLASRVEERMVGNWVASNSMTEELADSRWPNVGESVAEVNMAQRQWFVLKTTSVTANEDIRRIDITVSLDESGKFQVANLHTYVMNPRPKLVDDDQLPLVN